MANAPVSCVRSGSSEGVSTNWDVCTSLWSVTREDGEDGTIRCLLLLETRGEFEKASVLCI